MVNNNSNIVVLSEDLPKIKPPPTSPRTAKKRINTIVRLLITLTFVGIANVVFLLPQFNNNHGALSSLQHQIVSDLPTNNNNNNLDSDNSEIREAGSTAATSTVPLLNAQDAKYVAYLHQHRNINHTEATNKWPVMFMYRAMAGLGHQLLRMSCVYHLAMIYQIPYIWPTANPNHVDMSDGIFHIYNRLIGDGPLLVDIPYFGENNLFHHNNKRNNAIQLLPQHWPNLTLMENNKNGTALQKVFNFNNDVVNYVHLRAPMNLYGKDVTDYQFYHQLMLLFQDKFKERVQHVINTMQFHRYTVFGLHIRTGNGEGGIFDRANRQMKIDVDVWVKNTVALLCKYKNKHAHYFTTTDKPLAIYIGTDTGSVITKFQAAAKSCNIPILSAEQSRPEEGQSVSFLTKYDTLEDCLKSWEDMFLDMLMFTKCNTVIAGQYSSFTQSAPMSYIFHKANSFNQRFGVADEILISNATRINNLPHPHLFCDMGADGKRMECYDSLHGWLRQNMTFVYGDVNAPAHYHRIEVHTARDDPGSRATILEHFKNTVLGTEG